MAILLSGFKVRYGVFPLFSFQSKSLSKQQFLLARFLIFRISFVTGLVFSSQRGRYEISTATTPGKPGFYPWRSPPCCSFRVVMGLASWCVTHVVILVQLVNLNAVERVSALVYQGSLAVAETEVLVLHFLFV